MKKGNRLVASLVSISLISSIGIVNAETTPLDQDVREVSDGLLLATEYLNFTQVPEDSLSESERKFVQEVKNERGVHTQDNLYVISLGQMPNPGYRIEFVNSETGWEQTKVYLKQTKPKEGESYIQVIHTPYIVGKLDLPNYTTVSFLDADTNKPIFDRNAPVNNNQFTTLKYDTLSEEKQKYVDHLKHTQGIYQKEAFFLITAGQKPTTGYSLEVVKQEQTWDQIKVYVKLNEPTGPAGEAITYPYLAGSLHLPESRTVTFINSETGKELFGLGTPKNLPLDREGLGDYDLNEKNDIPEKFMNVKANKDWTVTFNIPMDLATLTKENLFITEKANGMRNSPFPVEVEIINENVVKIKPATPYRSGKVYDLHISKDVQSKKKVKMNEEKVVQFKVEDNFEIPDETDAINIKYDFSDGAKGWIGEFSDYPVESMGQSSEEFFELDFKHSNLPMDGKGLFITGSNHSDDLFMYIKKKLDKEDGIIANTTYQVKLDFDLVTNVPPGLVGIGGAPGESVFVKAGGTAVEPTSIIDSMDYYRTNIFTGSQANGGADLAQIGNVAKVHSEDESYQKKPFTHTFEVTTNDKGEIWLVIGTDSGFEGKSSLYYTNIEITASKK